MRRTLISSIALALIISMLCGAVSYAIEEWTATTQTEYDQLIAEIKELNEFLEACNEYLSAVESKSETEITSAKNRLLEINDFSSVTNMNGDTFKEYVETYKALKEVLLNNKKKELEEYVRIIAKLYALEAADDKRLEDEISDLIKGKNTYPINSTSKYLAYAERTIPEEVFTTLASENGKANTIYFVEGTVLEPLLVDGRDYATYKVLIQDHVVQVSNIVGYAIGTEYGSVFQQMEPGAQYVFPSIGETANFYLTYVGFSLTTQLPGFYLGAHESFVESNQ